ncbi:MAG TPA: pyrroline-5-carboxylate reductase [Polyangiaceae bacterium]|nr:pyrroline-5-carboxylate reductase [Polyangiaceae bacterium]
MDTKIGFLGAGNMAGALLSGLLSANVVAAANLCASDPRKERLAELSSKYGIRTTSDNAELVQSSNVVVLSVKPQVLPQVLTESGGKMGASHLVVSIAAGVTLAALEDKLGPGARVVRAMPNTPALAGAGATALAGGSNASSADLELARRLFDAVGRTLVLSESHLDAVTGLSGSGPGYVMLVIEALSDGGVKAGLPRDVAQLLAAQTVFGAAKLLLESGEHPAKLREMVTSPGGTTIAGLSALEAHGVRGAFIDAVEKATSRATELGKKSG